MLTVRSVPADDPHAHQLWAATWEELGARYGFSGGDPTIPAEGMIASLVGYRNDEPVGSVVVRFAAYGGAAPAAEIKRLFVAPGERGNGHARVLMGAAEEAAHRAGATRIILETGTEQPEAIALYRAIGYSGIPTFGPHVADSRSVCFAKDLPIRVLVLSGTIAAGKTRIAEAASDLLTDRGVRHGLIDADFLAQAEPAIEGDRFNQGLMFAALAGVAPAYRERGYGCMILPRMVEDDGDRLRYARAFSGPAGPAQVTIVRLTASEQTRLARVREREPEGKWREWHLARTVEAEAALAELGAEDVTIENDGRDRLEVAAEVLEAAGW